MSIFQEYFSDYGATIACGPISKDAVVLTTYGPEWIDTYFKQGFWRIDPIITFASQIARRNGSKLLAAHDMETALFEEAKLHNAASNVMATSFFGGSTMTIGGTNTDLREHHLPDLERKAQETHRKILLGRVASLSDSQIDLMDILETGVSEHDAAHEFGISVSAIAQRKRTICSKLGLTDFKSAMQIYSLSKWGYLVREQPNLI